MRARVAKLLVCLSLLIPLQLTATPANAGQDYWSTSDCRPDVWWINYTGYYGTDYWVEGNPDNPDFYFWVGGKIMEVYSQTNYQCGTIGAPIAEKVWIGYWYQSFEFGNIYYDNYWGCWRVEVYGSSGPCRAWGY